MFNTPVLFIVFNRPAETRQVFDQICELKPRYLFIASDGPRENHVADEQLCQEVRSIIKQIDWECELKTLFQNQNLGCGVAPATAITWFFEHVSAGIILEDDVLPHQSFFFFCEQMLNLYECDEQIMHISGCYFLDSFTPKLPYSHYYTKHIHVWGWATWRRAWKYYDYEIKSYSPTQSLNLLKQYYGSYYTFWRDIFNRMMNKEVDAWDYQWMYIICKANGLAINPTANLTKNIGFNQRATHTRNQDSIFTKIQLSSVTETALPDTHITDKLRDDLYYKYFLDFDLQTRQSVSWRLKTFLKKLKAKLRRF
ncbi:hemolytic protein HlpA [Mucilaginibacter koreensis]